MDFLGLRTLSVIKNTIDLVKQNREIDVEFDQKMDDQDLRQGVLNMLLYLDEIRRSAKKIGNAQRCFLYYYFKSLFDNGNEETYLNSVKSVAKAKQNYERDL